MSPAQQNASDPLNTPTPGFQGSRTSGVRVTIYHREWGDDPIIFTGGVTEFQQLKRSPKGKATHNSPSLVSVQTFKSIGSAAGTFTLTAKTQNPDPTFIDLFDELVDDDWVDIEFQNHAQSWHVMRGLIDDVRRSVAVAGSGATTTTFTISGRDFGKVWQHTPIWFSIYMKEAINGHFAQEVFTSRPDSSPTRVAGDSLEFLSPQSAVQGYLFGFLEKLGEAGRENWAPPSSLPGITNGSFVESLYFNTSGFSNKPARKSLDINFRTQNGTLWDLAQEWSDPMFTEMYVDLLPKGQDGRPSRTAIVQGEAIGVEESVMTVVYRDKPFPFANESGNIEFPKGLDSEWFNLPLFVVPREFIVSSNIGRGGQERFNAFFVMSTLHQETLGAMPQLVQPLWNKDDVLIHGLRRFDVTSKYTALGDELLGLTEQQREMVRDWYSMNPYLFNGNLELGLGMPDIRVGVRVLIPGPNSPEFNETYYVESVTHNWSMVPGTRTSLGVTRGWRGTDEDLIGALSDLVNRYTVEPPSIGQSSSEV